MTDRRRVIELRVHGVSGTPAEQMLDTPAVVPVAGNEVSGFWRPLVQPHPEPGAPKARERILEGYRWGGLTSRAPLRALWAVLAPFTLVNAAGAMHLPGGKAPGEYRGIAHGLEGWLVRLFGLSLTLMLVLAAFVTSVDIVGWQGERSHSDLVGFLDWSWLDTPAKRVAVLTLVPVAVLIGLWLLGRTTFGRYEDYPPSKEVHDRRDVNTPLECAAFWNGASRARPFQWAHLAAGLSFLGLLVAIVLTKTDDSGCWILIAPAAVLGASMLLCAIANRPSAGVVIVLVAAILVLAVLLAYTYFGADFSTETRTTLPGSAGAVQALFIAQVAVVIALALIGSARWKLGRRKSDHTRLCGTGTACVSLGAFVMGAAFSAGVILRVADLIGKARPTAELDGVKRPIITPDAMAWAARGVTVAFVAILLLALSVPLLVRLTRHRYAKPAVEPPSRRKKLASAIAWAKLTDEIDPIIGGVFWITLGTAAAAVVASILAYSGDEPSWLPGSAAGWRVVETVGTAIVVGFALGLVVVVVRSYRHEGLRRRVGILWDLATFWPRNAHPLGPPCYAERTVPELSARVAYFLLGDAQLPEPGFESSDVVVSAHSQGSVIAAAALLQMDATTKIALLSYGSPLRRLYRAYFPVYFGDPALDVLSGRVGARWRNLYRDTDPIGGPVLHEPSDAEQGDDAVDQSVTTPPARRPGDTALPAIEKHSNYPREPASANALDELDAMLNANG